MATKLETAYDDACAVFTRPLSFREWKFYSAPTADPSAQNKQWAPLGVSKDKSNAFLEIKHDVWIYVFRKYEDASDPPEWVEELFQTKDGLLHVVPMSDRSEKLTRNPQVELAAQKIGTTTRFPRRIRGRRTIHYFFASRVRLPLPSVHALSNGRLNGKWLKGLRIEDWAPAYSFEKDDLNLLDIDGKQLIVAVLDPLTVALDLHTSAEAASQDCMEYAAEQSDKNGARQCKVMLARILQPLLAADDMLYQEAKGELIDKFVLDYSWQVAYRQRWRNRWCASLVNWLDSAPFHLAFDAFREAGKPEAVEALLLFCRLLSRLSDTGMGRDLLLRINDGKPESTTLTISGRGCRSPPSFYTESEPGPIWEIVDKTNGLTIKAIKEWVPFVSTRCHSTHIHH